MAYNYLQPVNDHFDMDKFADVDDDLFLKNTRMDSNSKPKRSTNPFDDCDDESTTSSIAAQRLAFAEKRREIEQRTLDSSEKSLGLIYETEEVGKATAVELARQREQLEKTSNQLDDINNTLRTSQRHLNGLKSVFGGLKNYFAGNRDQPQTATPSPTSSQTTQETNYNVNPGGFGATAFSSSSRTMSPTERYSNHPVSRIRSESSGYQQQQQTGNAFQHQLNSNLDQMSDGLSILKDLALSLGNEVESQNDLIDKMTDKMEGVDIKVKTQNKTMEKLMK